MNTAPKVRRYNKTNVTTPRGSLE